MKLLLLQFDSSPTPSQVRSCAFSVSHPARVLAREIKPATQTTLANSQVVCLLSYGILNNVMFNLNYLFQLLARPTSLSTINNAEGKQRFFLFICLFIYLLLFYLFIFFFTYKWFCSLSMPVPLIHLIVWILLFIVRLFLLLQTVPQCLWIFRKLAVGTVQLVYSFS